MEKSKIVNLIKKPKLKMLCLHGLLQNSSILSRKLQEIITFIKPSYEIETIIPNGHLIIETDKETQQEKRGWFKRDDTGELYLGFDETFKIIKNISNEHPDIDIIFGFSQGGTVTVLTSMLIETNNEYKDLFPELKGVIICSTGIKVWPISKEICFMIKKYISHKEISLEEPFILNIPSLHIYGLEDDVVSPDLSVLTSKIYKNSILYSHPGKHFIPKRSKDKEVILSFIKNIIKY